MFKRENKYLIVKWDDIRKFLHPNDGEKLEEILEVIGSGRKGEGKKDNAYVVVNEDEPYAEIVWKLIEKQELLNRLDVIKNAYNAPDYYEEKERIEQRIWELERDWYRGIQ